MTEALITLIGALGLLTGIILYSTLSWGYVCFKFWYWFILPVFTELPHCTFWQCVGLMFFISLFRNQGAKKSDSNKQDINWGLLIISPWLTLLVAYLFSGHQ